MRYVLFGRDESDDFGVHGVGSVPGRDRVTTGAHIAFCASDAESVRRWHDAALRHGATDNGPPGPRPQYTGNYYAAFVLDLTGTTSKPCSTRRRRWRAEMARRSTQPALERFRVADQNQLAGGAEVLTRRGAMWWGGPGSGRGQYGGST